MLAALVGCTPEGAETAAAPAAEAAAVAGAPAPAEEAAAPELAGTAWRLLNIAEMDDSTDIPDDPAKYTLAFGADGTASMRADCNRGSGTWTSESPGQLTFGPIAATRAMCPPESLSDKYLAQFEWVRSYVMKDGHLFLATMADGSIIEFEPLPAVAATVFGEEIRTEDASEMQDRVLTLLFDRYAAEHGLTAEESEIDAFVESMKRGMAESGLTAGEDDLTPEEAAQLDTMRRQMGRGMIRQWKINKLLYEQYGGRIIYQQLGPEPLDAYRAYLEERKAAGDFTIENPELADAFWRYYRDESIHDFMAAGSEDEARAFAVPPWQDAP
jgi:heat shock protein HslJ